MTAFARRYIAQGIEQVKGENLAKERHLLARMTELRFTDFQEIPFQEALAAISSSEALEQVDEWITSEESFSGLLIKIQGLKSS